jgi:hypothetical protein
VTATETNILHDIGKAGIVDDQLTYDFMRTSFDQKPQEEVREVKIRVPANITDNIARNAWEVGMGTLQRLQHGMLVIAFPSVGKGPDGKPINTIGKYEVLISKPEDVKRILELAQFINQTNLEISKEAANPVNALAASLDGAKRKDEALRQQKQKVSGLVPLTVATKAPAGGPKPGGKIQIANR